MIAEYKKNVNLYVGGGLLLVFLGSYFTNNSIFPFMIISGELLYMYGLYFYAKAKGYSGWYCLFGLLSFIGLLILVLLPDHRKKG